MNASVLKKIVLPIAVGILLLVGIVVGIYLVRQQQEIREKAAPATVLNLTPSQDTLKVGETRNITVNIDTGPNVVGAIKLNVVFDPVYVSVSNFTRGTFFQTPIQNPAVAGGRLTMVAGGQVGNFPTGTGQVASFTVTALQAGSTVIAFDSAQTEVSGTGSDRNTNVLLINQLGSSSLTILAAATSPTPTQPLTPTPTTAPGVTVTVTPTPSNVVTPTPTSGGGGPAPTATATPTPTQAPGTTATPSPTRAPGTTATPTPTRGLAKKATATPTKVATGSGTLPQAGVGTTTVIFLVTGAALAILGILLLAL